jgi:Flp pilus assembly protein TadG
MRRHRRQRGQELVEFALVAPVFLFLMLGGFDVLRVVQVSNTAADAARQGARQAVSAAVAADQPFSSPNGQPCSGTTFTSAATGAGCLTDAQITATVRSVLGSAVAGSNVFTAAPGACPTPLQFSWASICINPAQATRSTEWSGLQQQGSFIVSVTVLVRYSPMTPLVGGAFPSAFLLRASTSMVAEY